MHDTEIYNVCVNKQIAFTGVHLRGGGEGGLPPSPRIQASYFFYNLLIIMGIKHVHVHYVDILQGRVSVPNTFGHSSEVALAGKHV